MKKLAAAVSMLALSAGASVAGGIDRSGQNIGIIFEDGNVMEFSYGFVDPNVSGDAVAGLGGANSGDMSGSFGLPGAGYKRDLSDTISMAVIWDQPFGADVSYPSGTGYPLAGTTGTIDTTSLTGVLRYRMNDGFSVHGGVRGVRISGDVYLANGPYSMSTDTQTDFGYLIGAAYEIPDIALRAALTYNSKITHDFNTDEGGFLSTMTTELPQSVNFDFRTGIAANTLLMFSARWVDWTAFDITPTGYFASEHEALVDYDHDTISYSLGVGRRINDKLAASIVAGYEETIGDPVGNLGPTDGYTSLGVGAKYQVSDNTSIAGGLRYVWVGDATTKTISSDFSGNTAVAAGFKVTYSF